MREINFNNLTGKDLIDLAALTEVFKNYLMEVLEYNETEADFVIAADFENPYDTPYIMQDYEGEYTVEGKDYEVRSCYTDFTVCGMFHLEDKPPFEFYMFFDLETLPDDTIVAYQNARKMYLV